MKWSFKIGRFAGIDVFLHTTFFLLIAWQGYTYWVQSRDIVAVISGIGFVLALFASVVLHEYGHALTARRYGIRTRDITLYPIGGVASLEAIPEEPRQELRVALAGPLVNVVISLVLFLGLLVTGTLEPLRMISITGGNFVERLMITNLILVGFNLLPAFPMDGGRVLRALLAMRMDYTKATQIAAMIGQGMALLFGIFGLMRNPFLVFIAFFVYLGAQSELRSVRLRSVLHGVPVSRAMQTDFRILHPDDNLSTAINLVLTGDQKDFPVVAEGEVFGILTQSVLLDGLRNLGENSPVSGVMQTDFESASPYEMLETAFMRLTNCSCHTLPVVQNRELVGLLTMDNLGEFIRVQSVLGRDGSAVRYL